MKTYKLNPTVAKSIGFEEAAFLGWLKSHTGNVVETGFYPIVKEHPCWTPARVKKMLKTLEQYEAISVVDSEKKHYFSITVNDTMLEKPKAKAELVDSREEKKYIVYQAIEGQGPTEVEMSGGQIIATIISNITRVNPDAKRFYAWRVERGAILDMLDQGYSPTTMIHYSELLPFTHGKPYAPVITSPREFALKFSKLAAFIMKEQEQLKSKENKYAI